MVNFKELREQLEPEDIKRILENNYGVLPVSDKPELGYIVYRTCCHNLEGGHEKLFYYKNTHLFKCYTECNCLFDIFDLIIKMENLRGRSATKFDALRIAGIKVTEQDRRDIAENNIINDLNTLYEINANRTHENVELKPLDINFLDERYSFDTVALQTWVDEGISLLTMVEYRITYDSVENCIIIPQFDEYGNVVGVRGRFFNEDADAKYKPIMYNGKLLNHPLAKTLYGFYQNKDAMTQTHSAIIFESEKSVMKMATIYGDRNISVATCGQTISQEQIKLLLSIGVHNIVLAYDADYMPNSDDMNKIFKKYKEKAEMLKTYFDVSLILDTKGRLGYKDAPIDRGGEIFAELMKERIHI